MGRLLGLPDVQTTTGATGGAYEFDQLQNHTFRELAKVMRFVGVFSVIVGILVAVGGVSSMMNKDLVSSVIAAVESVVGIVLGLYLTAAAENCRRIVDTQGQDIPNLMAGLDQLRRYFALQRILIIIALCLIGAALLYNLAR